MSYDLMIIEKNSMPKTSEEFHQWIEEKTNYDQDWDYNDVEKTTSRLKEWYMEMIQYFPPMNGPYALAQEELEADDDLEERVTDYTIGDTFIYASFAYSQEETALSIARKLCLKYELVLYNASEDQIVFYPKPENYITKIWLANEYYRPNYSTFWMMMKRFILSHVFIGFLLIFLLIFYHSNPKEYISILSLVFILIFPIFLVFRLQIIRNRIGFIFLKTADDQIFYYSLFKLNPYIHGNEIKTSYQNSAFRDQLAKNIAQGQLPSIPPRKLADVVSIRTLWGDTVVVTKRLNEDGRIMKERLVVSHKLKEYQSLLTYIQKKKVSPAYELNMTWMLILWIVATNAWIIGLLVRIFLVQYLSDDMTVYLNLFLYFGLYLDLFLFYYWKTGF